MPNSMTGYGKAKNNFDNFEIEIEIRSLNSRYLDIIIRSPKNLDVFESQIKEAIKKRIFRGKITLNITLNGSNANGYANFKLKEEALQYYYTLVDDIKNHLNLNEEITINHILQFKDFLQPEEDEFDENMMHDNLMQTLNEAVNNLVEMRRNEAQNIIKDIDDRIQIISKSIDTILKLSKDNPKDEYEKLNERVQTLLNGKAVDEYRLEMEIALLADRVDITEECTRMKSHLKQFNSILNNKEEVGKSLTFILQEMHREINTIGSKTTNVEVSHLAISIKEEIEKLREQVQNLE